MKIKELYSDVMNENLQFEFKAKIHIENNIKWAKTMVAYANGEGGVIFIGVSDEGEAFGISLAEALYFGKPALTFTIKGSGVNYVNINNETGLEAPNEDVKSYADNINKLLHDEALYKKLSEGAKERALTLFSKEHFVKTLDDIFVELNS